MTDLELTVDEGHMAVADRFFRAGTDLLALLDELSDAPVKWELSELRLGSAVARISPPTGAPGADGPLAAVVDGLVLVNDGSALPDSWTPDAVAAARKLAHVSTAVGEEGGAPAPAKLQLVVDNTMSAAVELTAELAARLDDLQPFERQMPGSVRGRLVGLNVSRGNRASLRHASGRVVRVRFSNDLRNQLKDAMFQDVELMGDLRQDGEGRVFHVHATDVRVLAKPSLKWSDLYGLDPDVTGGLSVADYLEATRGEA